MDFSLSQDQREIQALARDFAAFENALTTLAERGYVIRGRGGAPPATPR